MHYSLTGVWGADRRLRAWEGGPPALAARLHRGDQGSLQSVRHCRRVWAPAGNFEKQCPEENSFKIFFAKRALHDLCISSRFCIAVKELWRQWSPQPTAIIAAPHGHSWLWGKPRPWRRGRCCWRRDIRLCWRMDITFIWWSGYRWRPVKISRVQKNLWHEWCWKSKQTSYGTSNVLMCSSCISILLTSVCLYVLKYCVFLLVLTLCCRMEEQVFSHRCQISSLLCPIEHKRSSLCLRLAL